MSDPRLRLAPNLDPNSGRDLLNELDVLRPIVRLGSECGSPTAVVALATMLGRLFPHTIVEGDAVLHRSPWRGATIAEAVAASAPTRPTPTRTPQEDLVIGVGLTEGARIYLGGDDWTMRVGMRPQPIASAPLGLGLHAGAVFVCAEALRLSLKGYAIGQVPIGDEVVWNLLDYQRRPAGDLSLQHASPVNLAILGAGSVGSSTAVILASIATLTGKVIVVDSDTFDPSRNPFRYPAATGREHGPKAAWLASIMSSAGWEASSFIGNVAKWVISQPTPGFDGMVISSVDSVEGRLEVADVLARINVSIGVDSLALHVQRETLGDGFACPYCDFVEMGATQTQVEVRVQLTGLSHDQLTQLVVDEQEGRGGLTAEDIEIAVRAGKVRADRASELVGRRLNDLIGRVYAEAIIQPTGSTAPVSLAAPHVSWMGGVLAAAEAVKAAHGIALVDRRVDLDLGGLPPDFVFRRAAKGHCVCASPVRRDWMKRLYGSTSNTDVT